MRAKTTTVAVLLASAIAVAGFAGTTAAVSAAPSEDVKITEATVAGPAQFWRPR